MTPREYDMTNRAQAAEETRRRILDATLELHTERGIFGTSWKDIAERADVSVGTVYRHFPTLEELVPACGEVLMERTQPPAPEDAAAAIGDATDPVERLERAAAELFAFYERAGASLDSDPRERELPEMQEWEEYWRSTVTAFVHEALRGVRVTRRTLQVLSAFFDFRTYSAMRTRGVSGDRAARVVAAMAACHLGLTRPTTERSTG
jgi:AcrR family transcriptional regulator